MSGEQNFMTALRALGSLFGRPADQAVPLDPSPQAVYGAAAVYLLVAALVFAVQTLVFGLALSEALTTVLVIEQSPMVLLIVLPALYLALRGKRERVAAIFFFNLIVFAVAFAAWMSLTNIEGASGFVLGIMAGLVIIGLRRIGELGWMEAVAAALVLLALTVYASYLLVLGAQGRAQMGA